MHEADNLGRRKACCCVGAARDASYGFTLSGLMPRAPFRQLPEPAIASGIIAQNRGAHRLLPRPDGCRVFPNYRPKRRIRRKLCRLLAQGFWNFASSTGTFVFTSLSLKESFPSSHEKVYSKGNLIPFTSR